MKKMIWVAALAVMAGMYGCGQSSFSEGEYRIIMQDYLSKEFEESFDEKLSTMQKEKILKETAHKYKADYISFIGYMQKNHPDTYSRIF
ncbi:MAG: hypothetical protein ACRCUT_04810 [Spirochaetota bacterium]